jgi:L-seryl-tRNA(Ser) seleniumtransferase
MIMDTAIFGQIGSKPVINARGAYSTLGGAIFSPRVWAAMEAANRSFVDMDDLLRASGRRIASLLGADAALVTPGAAAALALGSAAMITRGDGARLERLPDTAGMPAEILIQRQHRYRYDRAIELSGARLVEVGDGQQTVLDHIKQAIGPNTAGICFPAHLDRAPGTVPLDEVLALARRRGLPTIVDAAYQVYPLSRMRDLACVGAELVCFSSKYMGGPNAGGFLCGSQEWIQLASRTTFTSFELGEHRVYGRSHKMDRHLVVAVVEALQEWLEMDHDARLESYEVKVQTMLRILDNVPGIELTPHFFTMEETLEAEPVNCLKIHISPEIRTSASAAGQHLQGLDPSIAVHVRDDALLAVVDTLEPGEEIAVAEQLRKLLIES